MRAFKRYTKRGFTLVELMIVVAIIGVLAALAIYGVRRYLASSKTAEAKNTIGAISRAAVGAYEREVYGNQLLPDATSSSTIMHQLCKTLPGRVPAAPPPAKKYQPSTQDGVDFNGGDMLTGWKCLKFQMSEPIYYSYWYEQGGSTTSAGRSSSPRFTTRPARSASAPRRGAASAGRRTATGSRAWSPPASRARGSIRRSERAWARRPRAAGASAGASAGTTTRATTSSIPGARSAGRPPPGTR